MSELEDGEVSKTDQWSRHYRPKSLETYIASSHVKNTAAGIIDGTKKVNSILITGSTGRGKTTLARILAYGAAGLKYGTPVPDIVEINVADKRGIDDIRGIVDQSRYRPALAKKRVIVLDEVHALTPQSAAALLKPLEEPQSTLMWILCTDQPEKLLATIVNRCLRISLEEPDQIEMVKLLMRVAKREKAFPNYELPDIKRLAKAVIEASGGVPRSALQIFQACSYSQGDFKSVKALIASDILKTPHLALDQAAAKMILAMQKAHTTGSPKNFKVCIGSMLGVEPTALLNRIISLADSAALELATGNRVNAAYPLISTSKVTKIDLTLEAIMEILSTFVAAKNQAGNFAVDVGTQMRAAIWGYYRDLNDDEE